MGISGTPEAVQNVPSSPWEAWTPTFTNFTIGNGTVVAAYQWIFRLINFRLDVVLGTTSSMGTDPHFSLPVPQVAGYTDFVPIGHANILDVGTANIQASCWAGATAADGRLVVWNAAGTYPVANIVNATVPITWTTGDGFQITGTYEPAS